MALARLIEEIEAASISIVCAEWVRAVLRAGLMRLTKESASWGVHLGICMHCSQT